MSKGSRVTMRLTGVRLNFVCSVAAVGLAVCLIGERHTWSRLDQANKELRSQTSQIEALLADNERLLALLPAGGGVSAQTNRESYPVSAMDESAKELLRLRGEAEVLRQENKAIESLREDTRQARATAAAGVRNRSSVGQTQNSGSNTSGSQLEIVRAVYGTDKAETDVTDELRDRIRGDSLKTIASNNLKGDPEFGQVKHLTIEYRFGGVTLTNQFQEGALVVLPPETMP